jgi:hypothetical protein
MMSEYRFDVEDGKYTFLKQDGDHRVQVLRHGAPWVHVVQGSNAVFSLLYDAIEDRKVVDAVRVWVGTGDSQTLHEAFAKRCVAYGEPMPEMPIGWRTDAPPRGVRCLVVVPAGGIDQVLVATMDLDGAAWRRGRRSVYPVLAWMLCPEPPVPSEPKGDPF